MRVPNHVPYNQLSAFSPRPVAAVRSTAIHGLTPLSAVQLPTTRMVPGAPENAQLRTGRPDWSREWGGAKTGGPNHRRHEVRSGLIRASLQANWDYAKQTHQLDKFFDMANRVLKSETFPVTNEKDADLILDRLYTRLHNNHMNIFYGRGSYNQMLGTLAHGLERNEKAYCAALDKAENKAQAKDLTLAWLQTIISYALCEYMDFSETQVAAVGDAVAQSLASDTIHLEAQVLTGALSDINLFEPDSRASEGAMAFSVHRERQAALAETAEVLVGCVRQAFDEYDAAQDESTVEGRGSEDHEQPLSRLSAALKDIARSFLDSADTDLSEARHDALRQLQNRRAIEVTQQFSDVIERPNLSQFEETANRFLALEAEGGNLLGIGPDYKKWFSKPETRAEFFDAITSENMAPSVESARFNPRQWAPQIRKLFGANTRTQRVQMVPSTLVRQVGYAVSSYAFGTDQSEKLMRAYERILAQKPNSIQCLADFQRAHATLIQRVHNNPTNIYIGARATQIARENVAFALESNQHLLNKAQAPELPEEAFGIQVQNWCENVITAAIQGYLALTPLELHDLSDSVQRALAASDAKIFKQTLESDLKSNLELFREDVRLTGALARYDSHQLYALRDKIKEVINLVAPLNDFVQNTLPDDRLSVSEKQQSCRAVADQLMYGVTHAESLAPDEEVRTAQNALLKFVDPLLRLKDEKVHEADADVIERYEQTLTDLLKTAEIAQASGLRKWAKGAGALNAQGRGQGRRSTGPRDRK